MSLPSKPTIDDGIVKVWTGKAISTLQVHAGEFPAAGPVAAGIETILHREPVPNRFHLTATTALGVVARCSLDDTPLPALLHAALAETFAADAVEAVRRAAAVMPSPKKPGKTPYDRAKREADASRRLMHAEALLRAYLDPVLHDAAAAWVAAAAPPAIHGAFHFDRQSLHRYGSGGVASTCTAHDGREPADLVVVLVPGGVRSDDAAAKPDMTLAELAETAQAAVARNGRRYLLRNLTNYEVLQAQGFPADHCNVPFRKKGKAGGMTPEQLDDLVAFNAGEGRPYTGEELRSFVPVRKQYECAGNSVAVTCMAFAVGRAVEAAAAGLVAVANDDRPAPDWVARIAALRRAGHDTLAALARCLEEDRTAGVQTVAANDNSVDVGIIVAGLGCCGDDAREVLALLAA